MKGKQKITGRASSVPAGLAWGAFYALVITLLGTAIIAYLVERDTLAWQNTGYGILIVILLSSWLGAVVTSGKVKRRKLVMCIGSGAIYFILLLTVTALFFGGHYSGVGETALLILCGSFLAVFSGYREKNGRNVRKYRIQNR